MKERSNRNLYRVTGFLAFAGSLFFFFHGQPLSGLLALGASFLLLYFSWVPDAPSFPDEERDDGAYAGDLSGILTEVEWHAPSEPELPNPDAGDDLH